MAKILKHLQVHCIPVKLPWIFPGVPLNFNGAPGNIQGDLIGMQWQYGSSMKWFLISLSTMSTMSTMTAVLAWRQKDCQWDMGYGPQQTNLTNPTMHQSHIPQCTIQNRNVHISVLNGAMWDMGQVHCGICEFGLLVGITLLWLVGLDISWNCPSHNGLWTCVTGGNFHHFSVATDSPLP